MPTKSKVKPTKTDPKEKFATTGVLKPKDVRKANEKLASFVKKQS